MSKFTPLSKESKSVDFDYKALTDFHHGLVYGFDAEQSVHEYSPNQFEYGIHIAQQCQDVMNAYLYAQNEVLATIRQQGIAKLTTEQLLAWINQIHQRIANTLAIDQNMTAGAFVKELILRWHPSTEMQKIVQLALAGLMPASMVPAAAEEIGADAEVVNQFLKIVNKIDANQSIVLSPEQKQKLPTHPAKLKIERCLHKLASAFYHHQLTAPQLAVVNQVITISPPYQEIPAKMAKFSRELLAKWQSCKKEDIDQIAELAFFAFYHLVTIHPYFNGNGRTATCLMNIILRSLDQPSILMRYPSERDDKNSSYSQAIAQINSQPKLLVQHIKSRLTDSPAYEDKALAIVVSKRMESANNYLRLQKYCTTGELNQYFATWSKVAEEKIIPTLLLLSLYSPTSSNVLKPQILNQLNLLLKEYGQPPLLRFSLPLIENNIKLVALVIQIIEQQKLLAQKILASAQSASSSSSSSNSSLAASPAQPSSAASALPATQVSPVVEYKYTATEKETIINKLTSLTGQTDWKAYQGGSVILLTMDVPQKPFAEKIVAALQKTDSVQAKLRKEAGGDKPVIQLTRIQLTKLLSIEKLTDFTISVDKLASDLQQTALK